MAVRLSKPQPARLLPTAVAVLWATAPGLPLVLCHDTYGGVCAWIDSSLLLAGGNIYCSTDGGAHWHFSEHRDAPPPTAGLAGELAELIAGTGVAL
jgi:hypothetical protein